jgi:antitoxin component YwqK of YwqJK toxin-antitoxin module
VDAHRAFAMPNRPLAALHLLVLAFSAACSSAHTKCAHGFDLRWSLTRRSTGTVERIEVFNGDERDGLWVSFHPTGQLAEIVMFVNGNREGLCHRYYSDGTLEAEGHYSLGVMDGAWRQYHFDGTAKSVYQYSGGQQVGLAREWSPQHIRTLEVELLGGARRLMRAWRPDGTPWYELTATIGGKRAGLCLVWNDEGLLDELESGYYKEGLKVSPLTSEAASKACLRRAELAALALADL